MSTGTRLACPRTLKSFPFLIRTETAVVAYTELNALTKLPTFETHVPSPVSVGVRTGKPEPVVQLGSKAKLGCTRKEYTLRLHPRNQSPRRPFKGKSCQENNSPDPHDSSLPPRRTRTSNLKECSRGNFRSVRFFPITDESRVPRPRDSGPSRVIQIGFS